MKKLKLAIISGALLLAGGLAAPGIVAAQPADEIQKGVNRIGGDEAEPLGNQIEVIVNILLFVLGAIAVIMIVIGGIRYATANGDQSALTSAKNTILYAVVGLVVAILAYAIVNFVLGEFIEQG